MSKVSVVAFSIILSLSSVDIEEILKVSIV